MKKLKISIDENDVVDITDEIGGAPAELCDRMARIVMSCVKALEQTMAMCGASSLEARGAGQYVLSKAVTLLNDETSCKMTSADVVVERYGKGEPS